MDSGCLNPRPNQRFRPMRASVRRISDWNKMMTAIAV